MHRDVMFGYNLLGIEACAYYLRTNTQYSLYMM